MRLIHFMEPVDSRSLFTRLKAEKLIEELTRRNFEAYYYPKKADVLPGVLGLIPQGSVVSCGGSLTLKELGLISGLKAAGMDFLDPADAQGGKAKEEIARRALSADAYLMSANAIAMTGEIVTLDGIGNRAAALAFGPKSVLIVAGMNKVEPNLETAVLRARTEAAPLTLLSFRQDYATYDEVLRDAENSYSHQIITAKSTFKGRIKVILVGEDLGY